MIKEKEQCIEFQRAKAERVKDFCDIEYHTPEDEKAIEEMDDNLFLEAWEDLKENVFSEHWVASGLSWSVCIFCIHYFDAKDDDYCQKCGYGENHGFCMSENSDWKKIKKETLYLDEKYFPNKFYRDLLNKIMEGRNGF